MRRPRGLQPRVGRQHRVCCQQRLAGILRWWRHRRQRRSGVCEHRHRFCLLIGCKLCFQPVRCGQTCLQAGGGTSVRRIGHQDGACCCPRQFLKDDTEAPWAVLLTCAAASPGLSRSALSKHRTASSGRRSRSAARPPRMWACRCVGSRCTALPASSAAMSYCFRRSAAAALQSNLLSRCQSRAAGFASRAARAQAARRGSGWAGRQPAGRRRRSAFWGRQRRPV